MDRFTRRSFAVACALFAGNAWVLAADAIESRPVHFAKGATSATVKGTLKGDQTIDYKLGARAGQTMRVTLKTSNGANYFNVLPPALAMSPSSSARRAATNGPGSLPPMANIRSAST